MNNIRKQLIVSEIAPKFFRVFGNVNKNKIGSKASNGEISLESMSRSIESSEKCLAKSQNAFQDFLIKRMKDSAIISVLQNTDEETADELREAMAKVESIKARVIASHYDELRDVGKFFQEISDVDPSIIKKVFSSNYSTGFDKIDSDN